MKSYLSICAVIKNETPYLEEWLEFHRIQGVEHFFLYDNGADRLPPFYFKNDITIHCCPTWNPVQFKAYNHCLNFFGESSQWIAFLDADEFLVPGDFLDGTTIPEFLKDMEKASGVAVNWTIFGSNGYLTKPKGLVIENYTRRQADLNPHVKSIMQPSKTQRVGANPHYFIPKEQDSSVIDEYGNYMLDNYALQGKTRDFIKIHHYHTKSREEYYERKLTKPDPGLGVIRSKDWVDLSFAAHDRNDVEDLSAAKFTPIIKERLCLL